MSKAYVARNVLEYTVRQCTSEHQIAVKDANSHLLIAKWRAMNERLPGIASHYCSTDMSKTSEEMTQEITYADH